MAKLIDSTRHPTFSGITDAELASQAINLSDSRREVALAELLLDYIDQLEHWEKAAETDDPSEIKEIVKDLEDSRAEVDSLDSCIEDMEGDITDLNREIEQLQAQLADLQED